jgi:hypothetical protein
VIFAFDHRHNDGDICSVRTCDFARAKPTLAGDEVFNDVPMLIVSQTIPAGWVIPPIEYGCDNFYEIRTD